MISKYPQDFIESKEREKKFLTNFLSSPFSSLNSKDTWNYSLYIEDKFKLMKQMRAEFIQEAPFSVTNRDHSPQKIKNQEFHYLYQRQGIKSDSIHAYPENLIPSMDFEYFTNSGQSALISSLLFLKNIPDLKLMRLKNYQIYFESNDAIELSGIPFSENGNCLFYDGSIQFDKEFLKPHLENVTYFLFDTTLFDPLSSEFKQVMDLIQQLKVPTLLIRSHLKLDSFGAEYSLLGSVVGLNLSSLPMMNDDTHRLRMGKCISTSGSFANIDQVYPFLGHDEFYKLTHERSSRIRMACGEIVKRVNQIIQTHHLPFKMNAPWHGLHFSLEYTAQQEINVAQEVIKLSKLYEIPAFSCDSFGFDFLSYTNISFKTTQANHFKLRFTAPDVPTITEEYSLFFENLLLAAHKKISV